MQRSATAFALILLGCVACATVEHAPTDSRLMEAERLFEEAQKLGDAGKYAEALPRAERALELRESLHGKAHPEVARCLNLLGEIHLLQGSYARAETLLQRSLAIRESALGNSHSDVAQSLNNLAFLYWSQRDYARAEPLYERALAIWEAALGKDHPDVAQSLNNLATLYMDQGFYARAEPLHERALAIWEAALGKSHPNVASSLNNLATLYMMQGLYARAEPLYERALAIWEASLGKSHPNVASSINNLAYLAQKQGLYARAEVLYERALAIRETAFGKSHPDVAASLNNLADLYASQGLNARAQPLHERALAIREAALGKNSPIVADSLNNLAFLHVEEGHYARAEALFRQALTIWESTLGESHPSVTLSLHSLAELYLSQNNLADALPLLRRVLVASEERLRQQVFGFSEARLASFLWKLGEAEERLYSLVHAHPEDDRVRHMALSTALLRKGRSIEELADTSRIVFRKLGAADREAFERLRTLRTQYSDLSLAGLGSLSPADYQQRLKDLSAQAQSIEEDLSRRAAPLRALSALPPHDEIVGQVAKALPPNGALIEFIAYREHPLILTLNKSATNRPEQLRYLALLLFADGRNDAVDLGPAEPIDTAAVRLHDLLARQSSAYQPAAEALYKLAFSPLRPHLGKVERLFVAPDGQLNLVPFAALHDGRRFLVDALDITYLTSGKELLPRPEDSAPSISVVVLANPDFSARPASSSLATLMPSERSASLENFFSRFVPEVDAPYPPLPGTEKEAETLHQLLPQARLLLGPEATKHALLTLHSPGILHIATHGFFREDAAGSLLPDPLLRSGLVLAGASAQQEDSGPVRREDSLVTALELAGLDLWGTQLVVLSACDTGRGDIKLGQGVYGLRRALVSAGAESVVTSLWKVNDETSRELMERYYRNLLAGQGRGEALRAAMRALRKTHPHPYSWAPFILIGRDTPLQGLAARWLSDSDSSTKRGRFQR